MKDGWEKGAGPRQRNEVFPYPSRVEEREESIVDGAGLHHFFRPFQIALKIAGQGKQVLVQSQPVGGLNALPAQHLRPKGNPIRAVFQRESIGIAVAALDFQAVSQTNCPQR